MTSPTTPGQDGGEIRRSDETSGFIAGLRRGIGAAQRRAARTCSPPEIRLRADRVTGLLALLDHVEATPDLVRAERARADAWERQAEINGRDWLAASADAAEARAERDRVRRQCAEELRTLATAWRGEAATYIAKQAQAVVVSDAEELEKVAASWSTPDPGESREIARMDYKEEQ